MRRFGWFARYRLDYRDTWRGRLASLLLLLPGMWLSVLLLRVPAGYGLTVPALLIDRLAMASTAVVLPVAVLLLLSLPRPGARAAAVVAGAVSAIVGLPTGLAALEPPRRALPTALALASIVGGVALVGMMVRSSLRARRWSWSFLAPLTLLPVIQFWQGTSYVPSQLVTSVMSEPRIEVRDTDGSQRMGVLEVATRNTGDVRATLLSSTVYYCFVTGEDPLAFRPPSEWPGNSDCHYWLVFDRLSAVDADTMHPWAIHWTAPPDKSLAIVAVISWYVREDRMAVEGSLRELPTAAGCQGAVVTYDLRPETRFKGVVQPTRLLTYDETGFYFSYDASRRCDPAESARLTDRLGVRFVSIRRSEWVADDIEPI